MRPKAERSGVLLLFFLLAAAVSAQAAGRVALVVGNSDYAHVGRLPTPVFDAADVGAALRRLGFEVTVTENADLSALTRELWAFTRDSEGADVALVFYAGYGMEMDGVNYLLPVDARLERDTDVWSETVTLDNVLASTSGAGLRLVILDACRNNPLARSMARTSRTRNVSNGSLGELNEDLLGDETLVAYSAAAGTTADDGEGRNSPYTAALLAHLEDPVDVGIMFRRVRARVLSATNERQHPHEYSSLRREHYLGTSGGGDVLADPAAAEAALGLDRASRRVLQRQLAAAGFDPGAPDGLFGPATRASIRSWQASHGLSATGYLDAAQVEALRTGASPGPAAARPRAGEVFRDCPSCPEMVVVPAGEFRMGSPASEEGRDDDEGPQHRVVVRSFALGRYEVTIDEWDACVRGGGCDRRTYAGRTGAHDGRTGAHPEIYMSWENARAYVRWLSRETGESYRLPSEAEWEYAARAGTTTPFHTGATISTEQAHYGVPIPLSLSAHMQMRRPVGTFAQNAFGLYDMHGNASEWTEDCWHDNYRGAPADGTAWTSGGDCDRRVLRGGSWTYSPRDLRSAARSVYTAGDRHTYAGFRVARTLD